MEIRSSARAEARARRGIRLSRSRTIRLVAATVVAASVGTLGAAAKVSAGVDRGLGYDPQHHGALSLISRITGAQAMWNAGYMGQGVGVALVDTGVTRVQGLDQQGKIIDGTDLSFDLPGSTLRYADAFGHGTHMAGIIVGSDVDPGTSSAGCKTCLGSSAYTDTTKFVGIAPEAHIVNIKVGAFDGAADVSQVIAGIYWAVDHRNDPGLNIRVLNLSFGTDSLQDPAVDPLARAVEYAWTSGIVVVAAGGNEGKLAPTLSTPASSPVVIAVGSTHPQDTVAVKDDKVSDFAQHGTQQRPVDFAAPGASVISLKVPGSFVDQNVTSGKIGTRFQAASGTSQATAIVSGLAAVLISKFPSATPDQIKTFLRTNATPYKDTLSGKVWYLGTGEANVANAVPITDLADSPPAAIRSSGLGSLEASRGTYHVQADGLPLTGETDIFGRSWSVDSSTGWDSDLWDLSPWTAGSWDGARWSAMTWDGARWSGARWSGARWSAGVWDGARWTGGRWSDAGWY